MSTDKSDTLDTKVTFTVRCQQTKVITLTQKITNTVVCEQKKKKTIQIYTKTVIVKSPNAQIINLILNDITQ